MPDTAPVATGVGRSTSVDRSKRTSENVDDTQKHLLAQDSDSESTSSFTGSNAEPSPEIVKRPPFVRRFSVRAKTHEFDVTNYGDKSIPQPPTSSAIRPRSRHQSEPAGSTLTGYTGPRSVSDISEEPTEQSTKSAKLEAKKQKSVQIFVEYEDETDNNHNNFDYTKSLSACRSIEKATTRKERGILDIAKRGRAFAQRKKDRLVEKNGECRIVYSKVKQRGARFLMDFFTTMLEMKWRYHFLMFSLAFGLSWVVFALIWWAIISVDMNSNVWEYSLDDSNDTVLEAVSEEYIPCVGGVHDFTTALLFSIETQHTIGYGTRAITHKCPFAIGILMFQSMFGVILQCILTGIIFAKMARPKKRAQTILFSKKAVICQRDGLRCLMFRVGDMRKSQIMGAKIELMMVERRVTKEGEYLPMVTRHLPVTTDSGSDFIFLAWPIIVMHKIDSDSPLWELSANDLIEKDWELIVVLEGVAEATGANFQVRTSYLPSEIIWGHALKSLVSKTTGDTYSIDYTFFHETRPLDILEISARRASMMPAKRYREDDDDSFMNSNTPTTTRFQNGVNVTGPFMV